MARAATSPELAYFRSENQRSELMLAIIKPPVVFAARVNQSFTSTDLVTLITYDTVTTGAYTALVAGMTMWVSASSGGKELGICRVRSATSTTITIGRTSDIPWADNLYITVVNEHAIWAKQALWKNNQGYMDDDVTYTDQMLHPAPVAVLGPDAVLELSGSTVNFTPTAAYSWTLEGTISSYSWAAPGASATSGLTTATPTITYNATGTYMVSCTITGSNGKTSTGYRVIYVWNDANPAASQFQVDSLQGDFSTGGWSFNITMFAGADLTTVYDRAKVILFSRDWYGATKTNIGPLSNAAYDSIIATGWIIGDTIEWNPEQSSVQFQVQGAHWWMDHISAFAPGVIDVTTTPANWTQYDGLTVDAGLWHFLYWRSTVCEMMDVYLTGDTRRTASCEAAAGSLWSQIKNVGEAKLAASPLVDALGRLFVEIDSQWLPVASRSGLPVVMDMTTADWRETMEITRQTLSNIAMYESGGFYYSGGVFVPSMGAAFGKNYKPFGLMDQRETFALTDLADAATWAGLGIGVANNDYPHAIIKLGHFNKLIDIAPCQYITASISSGDTPRGIVWSTQKLVPRTIQYTYNTKSGQILTDLDCEGASVPGTGVNIPVPVVNNNTNTDTPPLPPYNPPSPWFPPTPWYPWNNNPIPGPPNPLDPATLCKSSSPGTINGPYGLIFSSSIVNAGDSVYAYFPCWVRMANGYGETSVVVKGQFLGDAQANYTLVAMDSGQNPILSPTSQVDYDGYSIFTFAPGSGMDIAGFKLTLAPGGSGGGYGSFLQFWQKGLADKSFPIATGHDLSPDNSSYLNGVYTCPNFPSQNDWNYWLAVNLKYTGPSLPNGQLEASISNIAGDCISEVDGSHGFQCSLHTSDNGWGLSPYWSGYSNNPQGPFAVGSTFGRVSSTSFTPGTTLDGFVVLSFGFAYIISDMKMQINSLDWYVSSSFYVNLYPGTGWIPAYNRRINLNPGEIRNICAA
jgi:plastocyanin